MFFFFRECCINVMYKFKNVIGIILPLIKLYFFFIFKKLKLTPSVVDYLKVTDNFSS